MDGDEKLEETSFNRQLLALDRLSSDLRQSHA